MSTVTNILIIGIILFIAFGQHGLTSFSATPVTGQMDGITYRATGDPGFGSDTCSQNSALIDGSITLETSTNSPCSQSKSIDVRSQDLLIPNEFHNVIVEYRCSIGGTGSPAAADCYIGLMNGLQNVGISHEVRDDSNSGVSDDIDAIVTFEFAEGYITATSSSGESHYIQKTSDADWELRGLATTFNRNARSELHISRVTVNDEDPIAKPTLSFFDWIAKIWQWIKDMVNKIISGVQNA